MFEYEKLMNPPLDCEFKPTPETPDGTGLALRLNLDRITLEYLENNEHQLNETLQSIKAKQSEVEALPVEEIQIDPQNDTAPATDDAVSEDAENSASDLTSSLSVFERQFASMSLQISSMKLDITTKSEILGGKAGASDPNLRVIRSWNMVKGGVPVPVSFESISRFHKTVIDKLFQYCIYEAGNPTKKNEPTPGDTSSIPN